MHYRADVPLAVSAEELAASQPLGETAVSAELLRAVTRGLTSLPPGFTVNPKLRRLLDERALLLDGTARLDWAFAEALAFGTLLAEGTPVRLSGQDSGRGTFSQRHAVLYDASSGTPYVPLNNIRPAQASFSVYDSLLSENAVLGFEFGYSVADPLALVLWEAQFGDFTNGAQVIIDQFLAGSEAKWQEPCDLVLLLPHGYEGQGPEHSSARLERFLQLCAEDNMQVVNCSTPAQYFHVLRRQMRDNRRKPLVICTPKSLLRHPKCLSEPTDLTAGRFLEVIDDASQHDPSVVRRIVFCSGKVYYDALAELSQATEPALALVRLEQFYPFPAGEVQSVLLRYPSATEVFWLQEEPQNMGAWTFVQPLLAALVRTGQHLQYAGRPASAATATGSLKVHQQEQDLLVRAAVRLAPAPAGPD
jgi:2-oxoglutarate dehydrogenase E1 component